MLNCQQKLLPILTILGITSIPSAALAGPFIGVDGVPGTKDKVIPPVIVPGKEYSNHLDRQGHPNQNIPTPGQVVDWDANPIPPWGTRNGTNFQNIWNVTSGNPLPNPFQVDALANRQDFRGPVLLFSTGETAVTGMDTALDDHILYEENNGAWGIWAPPQIIDQVLPEDVDGLEVWAPINPAAPLEERINQGVGQAGAEGIPDANRYSLVGDPNNCSIFDSVGGCLITINQIDGAIDPLFDFDIDPEDIDLDALLFYEDINTIEFSVVPIDGNGDGEIVLDDPTIDVDGGEIFVWDLMQPTATFLQQGGHLWDTEFSVRGKFGTGSENVNALERVATPEPTSAVSLLAIGIGGVASTLKRKRNSSKEKETEK